jgi:hypothetical protein
LKIWKIARKLILAGNVKETASGNNISSDDNIFTSCFLKQNTSGNNISTGGVLNKTVSANLVSTGGFLKHHANANSTSGCLRKPPVKILFPHVVFLSNPPVLMLFPFGGCETTAREKADFY